MKRLLAGFVAGMLVWSTATAVLAAGTSQTIRACVKSSTGAMRIVSATATCKTGEKLLTWNTTGPAGPRGPQGPQGAQGPQGPEGGSGILTALGPTGGSYQGQKVAMVTITLPAGSFVLQTSVQAYGWKINAGGPTAWVRCALEQKATQREVLSSWMLFNGTVQEPSWDSLLFITPVTLKSADSLTLTCDSSAAGIKPYSSVVTAQPAQLSQ